MNWSKSANPITRKIKEQLLTKVRLTLSLINNEIQENMIVLILITDAAIVVIIKAIYFSCVEYYRAFCRIDCCITLLDLYSTLFALPVYPTPLNSPWLVLDICCPLNNIHSQDDCLSCVRVYVFVAFAKYITISTTLWDVLVVNSQCRHELYNVCNTVFAGKIKQNWNLIASILRTLSGIWVALSMSQWFQICSIRILF